MRSFLRLLSRRVSQTPRGSKYNNKSASVAIATFALPVAMFSSNVTKPTELGSVPEDIKLKSHHVKNRQGETVKFQNPHPSFQLPNFWEVFKLLIEFKAGRLPKPTGAEVNVVKPKFLPSRTGSDTLRATWLGHACYYVEYPSGLRVLFDPVFEDCCTPNSLLGFKRFTKPACEVSALPFVDAVVISHSHYDHLSYPTVQEIQKHHPDAHYFVGLGLKEWFNQSGISQVTEMDWWQDVDLTLTPRSRDSSPTTKGNDAETKSVSASSQGPNGSPITARFSCLPCQHGSGRSPFDQGKTLWCSWAVSSGTTPTDAKSVWFGGDTGYRAVPKVPKGVDDYGPEYKDLPRCPQFRQIGELRGPFDLGLIPIGAYAPRHLFSGVHADPFDAVEMFQDTRCRKAVGIHWGTWVLTTEDVSEPPKLLAEAAKRKGLEEGSFGVCDIGETREF